MWKLDKMLVLIEKALERSMVQDLELNPFKDKVLFQAYFEISNLDIFNSIHFNVRAHRIITLLTVFFSVCLIFSYLQWLESSFPYNLFLIFFTILLVSTLVYIPLIKLKIYHILKKRIKHIFNDQKPFIQNLVFYDQKFYSSILDFSFDYSQVSAIYRSERGYFIEVPATKGFFIRKNSFVKGIPSDFDSFIESRTNKNITYVSPFLFAQKFRDALLIFSILFCIIIANLIWESVQKLTNNPFLEIEFTDLGVKEFRPFGVIVVPLNKEEKTFDPYNSVFAVDYVEMDEGKMRFAYKVGPMRSEATKLIFAGVRSFRVLSYNNGRNFFYIDPKLTIEQYAQDYYEQNINKIIMAGGIFVFLILSWIFYLMIVQRIKNPVLKSIL